ncbi:MAG: hypothetical protein Q9M94_01075 [Candidatus Gracilibacteria bacterium]|nr:hypothetical protein [Candidatus Gracilibacteria bacterium]MDQ7022461.1 hypothetical protein [Candidatus Gracilibacteria bacterium]
MQNNKIIIAESEKIFLEFIKSLDIKDIKTNEEIIIGEKNRENSDGEEENLVVIHGKDILKTIEFVKNNYILIEKILICNKASILSNGELKTGDIIIPNTFISKSGETKFLDNTIGKDYDMNNFGLMLSGISSEKNGEENEFEADISSKNIFIYLKALDSEELLEKTIVISQIGEENYINLVAVSDMIV